MPANLVAEVSCTCLLPAPSNVLTKLISGAKRQSLLAEGTLESFEQVEDVLLRISPSECHNPESPCTVDLELTVRHRCGVSQAKRRIQSNILSLKAWSLECKAHLRPDPGCVNSQPCNKYNQ